MRVVASTANYRFGRDFSTRRRRRRRLFVTNLAVVIMATRARARSTKRCDLGRRLRSGRGGGCCFSKLNFVGACTRTMAANKASLKVTLIVYAFELANVPARLSPLRARALAQCLARLRLFACTCMWRISPALEPILMHSQSGICLCGMKPTLL